jgi:hypothetical protein
MDWIDQAQNRDRLQALVSTEMNLLVPLIVGNFQNSRGPSSSSIGPGSFSIRTLLHGVIGYFHITQIKQ